MFSVDFNGRNSFYLSSVQPSLWPTSTQSPPSDVFDPFASFEPSTNIFPSNEYNSFTYQTQPIVPSANQPKPNSFTVSHT